MVKGTDWFFGLKWNENPNQVHVNKLGQRIVLDEI